MNWGTEMKPTRSTGLNGRAVAFYFAAAIICLLPVLGQDVQELLSALT